MPRILDDHDDPLLDDDSQEILDDNALNDPATLLDDAGQALQDDAGVDLTDDTGPIADHHLQDDVGEILLDDHGQPILDDMGVPDESMSERVLNAVHRLLQEIPDVRVAERNSALPERITDGGLIILRDGEYLTDDSLLGGFDPVYVTHTPEIVVMVQDGDATERDRAYDRILRRIADRLIIDRTLGGLAFGLTIDRPTPEPYGIDGAAPVKASTVAVTIEYEAPNALG